jgi:hypothetical protein
MIGRKGTSRKRSSPNRDVILTYSWSDWIKNKESQDIRCPYLSICLSIYLSIYLSICLSVCLSVCLSSIYLSIYLWHCSLLVGSWQLFRILILYTVGRTPLTGDQPVVRPLPTHRTIQTQNKRKQTTMLWVVLEPRISVFKRAKKVLALDRAAAVIDIRCSYR